ncbi:MAG: hypothetical protein HGB19_06310 [Chlorobiales bacterium]|nr:hypothetical protein [Chlorobiales bacterium]
MNATIETTESPDITLKVHEAQIRQLYKQSWIGLTGIFVNIVLVSIILWEVIPHWKLLLWSSGMLLVTVARSILIVSFHRKSPSGSGIYRWARLHVAGTTASGVMWALPSLFLWPSHSPLHQMVWPICIVAVSASAVAIYSTWKPSYISFLVISTVPVSIRLFSEGRLEYTALGFLGLFFIGVLIQTGKMMHAAIVSSFSMSIRNEALSSVLAADKAKVEELNGQLQEEIAKRTRSQEELQLKNKALERSNHELEVALANVKQLSGMLPICASCKKIRNDDGYWEQIEAYIHDHSDIEFSHGICPECAKRLYPDFTDRSED